MPKAGASRFIPLVVIAALIVALGVAYGPGVVRAWKFRSTCNAMLREIRAGSLNNLPGYVAAEQQTFIGLLVRLPMTRGYADELNTLKLSNYYSEEDHIWAIVTADVQGHKGQGQLRWEWDGKEWKWNPRDSYYRFGVLGDQPWLGLADLAGLGKSGVVPLGESGGYE